jgi:hypothetical protein
LNLIDNGISSRQNLAENIHLLAAQRHLYARVKRLAAIQALLVGFTPVVSAFVVAVKPEWDIWAAFSGIVVALCDTVWLDPKQNSIRSFGANVQESFDCNVLQLPWNGALAGRRPSPEDVHEAAEAYSRASETPLEDWYPRAVSSLPLYQGRLICQRTNCWWDSKQRKRYGTWIVSTLSVLSVAVFLLGLVKGLSLQKFVLAVMTPLLPAALWAAREFRRHIESATESDRLKEYGESLWEQVVAGEVAEPEVVKRSRELQDAILVRRRESAPVLNWVYKSLRSKHEDQMNVGAQKMVDQINNRPGSPTLNVNE